MTFADLNLNGAVEGQVKQRLCLRCRGKFTSRHYGERTCPKCKQANATLGRVRRGRFAKQEDSNGGA